MMIWTKTCGEESIEGNVKHPPITEHSLRSWDSHSRTLSTATTTSIFSSNQLALLWPIDGPLHPSLSAGIQRPGGHCRCPSPLQIRGKPCVGLTKNEDGFNAKGKTWLYPGKSSKLKICHKFEQIQLAGNPGYINIDSSLTVSRTSQWETCRESEHFNLALTTWGHLKDDPSGYWQ